MLANYVFLLNADRTPLDLINPARARKLQSKGKASVLRYYPYTLILHDQVINPTTKSYSIKIDPGSKWTGFAIQCGVDILFRMELNHRGETIKSDLQKRAGFRRGRRSRNLRYRKARFNRRKHAGWLAPSLTHRLYTVETWIKRFISYAPIDSIEIEQVRFDTQKLANSEISGTEYTQGTLMGYEVRQYLLEKWGRSCAYCDAQNIPLEIEHIVPKSKNGSDRASNLTLACHACNQAKSNRDIQDFLADKPQLLNRILSQAKSPLRDAAAVNSTRLAIVLMAKSLLENVKCWTGGRTKFNCCSQNLPKSHSIDAACVGESGAEIVLKTHQPLFVTAKGHGSRQARRANASGFPAVVKAKATFTHITAGDVVSVVLPKDRKHIRAGTYTCRVKTPTTKGCEVLIQGHRVGLSSMKTVSFIHRSDGYGYSFQVPDTLINSDSLQLTVI